MMRYLVELHGQLVGWLTHDGGNQTAFRFAEHYLRAAARPVLSRWYEDHLTRDFVDRSVQSQLPPFFQNYLPEQNSPLRELLARRANVPSHHELPLLVALGEDLPGAVVVRAAEPHDGPGHAPSRPLTDQPPDGPLRFSLAGMQLKFSVLKQESKLTLPVTGAGGRHILKVPARDLPGIPANEFSMMRWAAASGITVPDVELVPWRDVEGLPAELAFDEELALLVKRFDRPNSGGPRVHQEDFAQVLCKRPDEKYGREAGVTFDRIGRIIAKVCGAADFEEFVRRLVFVILCCNPDAHLKNWSLWYPNKQRARLAPAYDLVSTSSFKHITRELAHRLGKAWDLTRVTPAHFGVLASHAGLDAHRGVTLAREAAERTRGAWLEMGANLPLARQQRDALARHLDAVFRG